MISLMRVAGVASLMLSFVAKAAGAQRRLEDQVRTVADSFFAAIAAQRWPAAATLVDMEAFNRLLGTARANARTALPTPPMTVEQLMANDSTLPRAVAEWQVSQMRQYSTKPFSWLSSEFAGVDQPRDLFALTPAEAAARWLEAQDPSAMLRRNMPANCPMDTVLGIFAPAREVLAVGLRNDSTAYVVHSGKEFAGVPDPPPFQLQVLEVKHTRSGWRIVPRQGMNQGMGVAFALECHASAGIDTSAALLQLKMFVGGLVQLEEAYFVRHDSYGPVSALGDIKKPDEITITSVDVSDRGVGWSAVAISSKVPGTRCGIGVNAYNTVDRRAPEGEVACGPESAAARKPR